MPHPARLVLGLLVLRTAAAAAQAPQWCTTTSLSGHIFQGCGVARSADESARQAYGEVARLLESRVRVSARSVQGQSSADTRKRGPIYDTTSYDVRLQSDVALHGLRQRQATSRGRVYTLVTFDAGPALDRINGALLDAGASLLRGELAGAVAGCRRVSSMIDSLPWLGGLTSSDLDCPHIIDVLDAGVRVSMAGAAAARVSFQDAPVSGVYLVTRRERGGIVRTVGPSDAAGIVDLPPATAFGFGGAVREQIDVDWERSGLTVGLPFRERAARKLETRGVTLAVTLDSTDDWTLRRSATAELQNQLGVAVDVDSASNRAAAWRLFVSGSWRDVAASYGGERVASATMRWNVVDARSGQVIGAGAIVDQRGRAADQPSARDAAVHLAVRRVVAELERLSKPR